MVGLDANYLRKQLNDFASGARDNAVMQPIAKALSEDERKALADYYVRMPVPAGAAKPQGRPMPARESRGAVLASRGLWTRQLPSCVQCHGPQGLGVGEYFPPLAGQPAVYIAKQLRAWKQGTRRNDPLELMQNVAVARSMIATSKPWPSGSPRNLSRQRPGARHEDHDPRATGPRSRCRPMPARGRPGTTRPGIDSYHRGRQHHHIGDSYQTCPSEDTRR